MSDVKISDLPAATALDYTETVPVVQGGFTKQVPISGIRTGLSGTFTGLSDTPTAYTSQTLKLLRVNAGASAVEFVDPNSAVVGDANAVPYFNSSGVIVGDDAQMTYNGTALSLLKGQIKFPATQNASADANTLDDYEEGTWTPTVAATTGSITSYTVQVASYTKIGNVCLLVYQFTITNNGTGSGLVTMTLPFTAALRGTGVFREGGITGKQGTCFVSVSTSTANMGFYDNTYPGATNHIIAGVIDYIV